MLEGVIQSKSKTFITLCLCILIGIALGSVKHFSIPLVYWYASFFVFVCFFVLAWKKKTATFIVLCSLFIVFSFVRAQLFFPAEIQEGTQTMVAQIVAEPDVRIDGVRYVVEMRNLESEIRDRTSERLFVKMNLYPRYQYGDTFEFECDVAKPEPFEGFRYDMYLARLGVSGVCNGAKVLLANDEIPRLPSVARDDVFLGLMSKILSLKDAVAEKINLLWHEPHASFMAGLLYGYRGGLGSLDDAFNRTGVTHIIAISGYNISIVASILFAVLVKGFWINRKKSFWFLLLGIGLFVLFTGASASVVRAGIMGSLVLLAKQLGRQKAMANVLALTAVLMALFNPFALLWDAGFQLSFVAVVGLIYLAPIIEPKFEKVPEVFGLRESVVSTLSAIIATAPLIAYQFGRVSLVALPANILILWIIPFLMFLGFFAVVASFIFLPVAQVIAWITWAGLSYIIVVVKWLSGFGFASVELTIPFFLVVILYVVLLQILFHNRTRIEQNQTN